MILDIPIITKHLASLGRGRHGVRLENFETFPRCVSSWEVEDGATVVSRTSESAKLSDYIILNCSPIPILISVHRVWVKVLPCRFDFPPPA